MISRSPRSLAASVSAGKFGSDHRLYDHAVQFYFNDGWLVSILCELVFGALADGHGAVILATEEHQNLLAKRLRGRGVDVTAHISRGTYVAMEAAHALCACTLRGKPDESSFAQLIGGTLAGSREAATAERPFSMVYGELVSLLWAKRESESVLALEHFWQNLASKFSFSLLCGYPIKDFADAGTEEFFLRICAQHSTIVSPEEYPSFQSEKRILEATARSLPGHS